MMIISDATDDTASRGIRNETPDFTLWEVGVETTALTAWSVEIERQLHTGATDSPTRFLNSSLYF
jgi:hypothetical protein